MTEPNVPGSNQHSWVLRFRMLTSVDDLRSLRFWKAVAAEFLGTMLLTMVGCGSCIGFKGHGGIVQIALCFGLSVATVVWIIGHVSGGHINPAVTAGFFITRRISLARAIMYVISQCIGAIIGAGILKGLTPGAYQGTLGATTLQNGVDGGMGFGVELFITFILVMTVFAACDKKRKDLNGSFPLSIGLSVTMCHLWAVQYTGSSMNTARSFGPAVVMSQWDYHWVYWLGPLLGGILAGLVYDNTFAVNASLEKARSFLLSSEYDNENFPPKKSKIKIIEEEADDHDTSLDTDNKHHDPA